MLNGGNFQRTQYPDTSMSRHVAASENHTITPLALIPSKAKYTLFIQSIVVAVMTEWADETERLTFQSITTDVPVAWVAGSSAGGGGAPLAAGPVSFPFGDEGFALPEGEGLELIETDQKAFSFAIQAYYKKTAG